MATTYIPKLFGDQWFSYTPYIKQVYLNSLISAGYDKDALLRSFNNQFPNQKASSEDFDTLLNYNTGTSNTNNTNTGATTTNTANTNNTNTNNTNTTNTNNTNTTNTGATNNQTTNPPITFPANFKSLDADSKRSIYQGFRSQGYTDAEIRAAADRQFGIQTNDAWNSLTGNTSTGNTTNTGATNNAGTTNTQTTKPAITFPANITSQTQTQKTAFYNDLLSKGYTNAEIRAAAQAQLGIQTDADWNALTGQGTNTGGANTGGANTGGTNTGGANTGGTNTGGANSGALQADGTSKIDPIIAPYLTEALGRARSLFLTGKQPSLFPGQMYVSPSQQTLSALSSQEAIAMAPSAVLNAAQNAALQGLNAPVYGQEQLNNLYSLGATQPGISAYQRALAGEFAPNTQQLQQLVGQAATQIPSALSQTAAGAGLPSTTGIQALAGQAMPGVSDIYSQVQSGQFQNLALPGTQDVAGGSFLTGSPYQEALISQSTRPITEQFLKQTLPALQSQFSMAGRYGSGAQERAIGSAAEAAARTVGDVATQIGQQTYTQERGFQEAARSQLAGLSQQDLANRLGAAGTIEAQRQAQLAQAAGLQGQLFGAQSQNLGTQLGAAQTAEQMRQAGVGQQANILGQVAGLQQTGFGNIFLGAQGLQGVQAQQFGQQMGATQALSAAQQQALQTQLATANQAPQFYAQQFLPSQALAQVGAQREAIAGQPLQEQIARYNYAQQLPYAQLSGYLSSIYGSPLGSLQQFPQTQNSTLQNIGGFLSGGAALYSALPSNTRNSVGNFFGSLLP